MPFSQTKGIIVLDFMHSRLMKTAKSEAKHLFVFYTGWANKNSTAAGYYHIFTFQIRNKKWIAFTYELQLNEEKKLN